MILLVLAWDKFHTVGKKLKTLSTPLFQYLKGQKVENL